MPAPREDAEDRVKILGDAADMIFKLMCDRATSEQWTEWLRAPLEHAAGTANRDLVEKLLKAGADGSAGWRGCDDNTLLHAAAGGGNEEVVTALIRAGAGEDMEAKTPGTGGTPLHVAVMRGQEAAARVLVLAGADVNAVDHNTDTPLHLAIGVLGVDARIAQDLLLSGANPKARGFAHDCPIHVAASHGRHDVVHALAHTRADLDALDGKGMTPISLAVEGDHVSTVKVLLAAGADAKCGMNRLKTALHVAAECNKSGAIPALIEAGADIEARMSLGRSPLWYAAWKGSCAAMLVLLQLGADTESHDEIGWTCLHAASQKGHADAADLLLRWGADEMAVDNEGVTTPSALMPAIAQADERDRPRLERLAALLEKAPQDRAWRRRGFLVLCRAHPERLRLVEEIPDMEAESTGQPRERRSQRARTGQVKVEIELGGRHGQGAGAEAGAGSRDARAGGRAGHRRPVVGFDVTAAWLMAVKDEGVFCKIVGFL